MKWWYEPEENEMRWHYPSKGEYPTERGRYLVVWRGEYVHIDFDQWVGDEWLYDSDVIAWMPLPEPPQEEV